MVGRSKKEIFAYIKDHIWKRVNGWRSRPLFRVGKEVMIKQYREDDQCFLVGRG
jgi:hypothetical protein